MNLNKLILTSLCAIITATAAFATGENIVASKKYTDDTFQTKISAEPEYLAAVNGNAGALIGATDTNGVVSQRLIIPGTGAEDSEIAAAMSQMGLRSMDPDDFSDMAEDIYRQITGSPLPYEGKYSVPSMELFFELAHNTQPMIPQLDSAMEYTPGFVLLPSGGDDGQLGLRFIIPGLNEMPDLTGSGQNMGVRNWWLFGGGMSESEVIAILDDISRQFTDDRWINGETVGMTLNDVLYSPASLKLVSDVWNESQRTITGHAANAADSILTDSATNGVVQKRAIFDGSATYAAATHATHIPTMGAVMSAITNGTEKITWSATQTAAVNNYSTTFDGTANNWVATDSGKLVDGAVIANAVALKQNKVPAGTAGNVVTYTGTAGVVGSVATYDGSTTYNSATDASKVAIMSAVQRKKVCAGWPDSVAVADRTDANCWLWELPD